MIGHMFEYMFELLDFRTVLHGKVYLYDWEERGVCMFDQKEGICMLGQDVERFVCMAMIRWYLYIWIGQDTYAVG